MPSPRTQARRVVSPRDLRSPSTVYREDAGAKTCLRFARRSQPGHRQLEYCLVRACRDTADGPSKEGRSPMSQLERRQFLRKAVAATDAVAAMPAFQGLHLLAEAGRPSAAKGNGGYGPLIPTADLRDGVTRIALPEGFSYRTFSPAGALMSDGHPVPLAHDAILGNFQYDARNNQIVGAPLPITWGRHRRAESSGNICDSGLQSGSRARRRALPPARRLLVGQRRGVLR